MLHLELYWSHRPCVRPVVVLVAWLSVLTMFCVETQRPKLPKFQRYEPPFHPLKVLVIVTRCSQLLENQR